jgi:hypothetical protein
MGDFTQFQEPVWDRFFDFVFECDEDLSRAEVQEELRRRGIDVTRAVSKVQQVLRTAKARRELETARKSRLGLLARVKEIAHPGIAGGLEELKRRIAEQFQGQTQAAFFRKLEAVESKEDLRSLLEDAHLLDALSEESGDVRAEAE